MTPTRLRIDTLDSATNHEILARNTLGRLAFSFQDRVDIRPLNYTFRDEWIFGRTSPGEKLLTVRHHRWVAFQVDEIKDPFDWVSVVAHGPFYLLDAEESQKLAELTEEARTAIREADPQAFTSADATPERTLLFGIAVQELNGRKGRSEPLGQESGR